MEDVKVVLNDPCEQCHDVEGETPHTCPFAEEIHGDDTTLCNCCENCAYGCAMEI